MSESGKKVYVKPRSKYQEYVEWIFRTQHTEFIFTYNKRTKKFFGQRTGDNEYSCFGNIEVRRVISELHLVLVGL